MLKSLHGAACFDGDGEVGPGMFDDAVQARGGKDEIGAGGRIAPSDFCASAARNDGDAGFVGEVQGRCELLFGGRFEDEMRLNTEDGVGGRGGADLIRTEECG